MRFTLRQLEIFVAIGEAGSASRAAEKIALSQSAVSTALAELERACSAVLFDRVGKSLALNDTGKWLLPRARQILDRAHELEDAFATNTAVGPLRLGASLTIGNYLATFFVADFLQQNPGARIELAVRNSSEIAEAVARFELDLGLVEGDLKHPELISEPWLQDELVVFAAPTHRLAKKRKVSLDDVLEENWILREPGSGTRSTVEHAFGATRHRLKVTLELGHTEAIKRAVEAGLGLGCISRLALRDEFSRGTLKAIRVGELNLDRSFFLLRHRQKYLGAGLAKLIEHIRTSSRGARSAGELQSKIKRK